MRGSIAIAMLAFAGTVQAQNPISSDTVTSKGDLVAQLKQAAAYCDSVYDAMTDAAAAQKVKGFVGEPAKIAMLDFNTGHMHEHNGNLVTYVRIKGLAPPSSEKQGQ